MPHRNVLLLLFALACFGVATYLATHQEELGDATLRLVYRLLDKLHVLPRLYEEK